MATIKDSFLDLERHRLQLEQTVGQLETALNHWRKWDAEYEALREEISPLSSSVTTQEAPKKNVSSSSSLSLERAKRDFKSVLINDKEKDVIFGSGKAGAKTLEQVCNILDRRLDYVGKNINTLESQLTEARRKMELAAIVGDPGLENDDGPPFTEITEELDADGNVVNYQLLRPGEKHLQFKEALEKAGNIQPDSDRGQNEAVTSSSPVESVPPTRPIGVEEHFTRSTSPYDVVRPPHAALSSNLPQEDSFHRQDSDPGHFSNSWDVINGDGHVSGDIKITPDDDESCGLSKDLRDASDDLDESSTYNPDQLSMDTKKIVAIFQDLKDDDLSDYESMVDDDDEWEDCEGEDEDDSDQEDQYGRSTKRVVSREYEERVMAIKKRLGLDWQVSRSAEDYAVGDEEDSSGDDDMHVGRIAVNQKSSASSSFSSASREPPKRGILKSSPAASPTLGLKKKKSVRFAEELDIAPSKKLARRQAAPKKKRKNPAPVREELIVREGSPVPDEASQKGKKATRFRQHLRQDNAEKRGAPGASAKTHATMADITVRDDPAPSLDPEYEADMAAISEAYHDKRRRMIQQQAGFAGDDRSSIQAVEEDGTPKRVSRFKSGVSRFKAARLGELEENA